MANSVNNAVLTGISHEIKILSIRHTASVEKIVRDTLAGIRKMANP